MKPSRLIRLGCALALGRGAAAGEDASALVQGSVRAHRAEESVFVGDAVRDSDENGPMAYTKLGPILGKKMDGYNLFAGIPYAEQPERFEPPQPKKPWGPEVLEATRFRHGCVGAQVGVPESEDCLRLQVWVPQGGHKNLPVVVYFHGGINQHGSGFDGIRRGDLITQNQKYPIIWINFDFRLGILGWFEMPGSNVTSNLGFLDQQAALRWVQENIAAFGGDPARVTLQGQSEGCGTILMHYVSPTSAGLFSRAAFHSPVADIWSRRTNEARTKFIIEEAGCKRKELWSTMRCLRRIKAHHLWYQDWSSVALSRSPGSPTWVKTFLSSIKYYTEAKDKGDMLGEMGWHPIPDGVNIPDEPRTLIREGRFNKAPLLITVSPNETYGTIPDGIEVSVKLALDYLLNETQEDIEQSYEDTLTATGVMIRDHQDLVNQLLTDKLWTCDARSLASEMTRNGGRAYIGMFAHVPKFDPIGMTTSKICEHGATCHASEMLYVLPQGEGDGAMSKPGLEGEKAFSMRYSESFLAFAYGKDQEHPWAAWDDTQPITFYDANGTRTIRGYRRQQCDVLARADGDRLPVSMHHTSQAMAGGML